MQTEPIITEEEKKKLELELRKAATSGDASKVALLLNEKGKFIDIDARSPSNDNTALFWAIEASNSSHRFHVKEGLYKLVFDILLSRGASTSIQLKNKTTKKGSDLTLDPYVKDILTFREKNKLDFSWIDDKTELLGQWQVFVGSYRHLIETFGQLNIVDKFKDQKKIKAVSIACGFPAELLPFLWYLEKHGIEMEFTGIDINEKEISRVKKMFKNYKNVAFFVADTTKESCLELAQLKPNCADIIFFRNPNVLEMPKVFYPMLFNIIPRIGKQNSFLFASFYNLAERESLLQEQFVKFYDFLPKSGFTCAEDSYYVLQRQDNGEQVQITPDRCGFICKIKKILEPKLSLTEENKVDSEVDSHSRFRP